MKGSIYRQIRVDDNDVVRVEGNPVKAYLIRMPEGSPYEGLNFWHPAKCTFKLKRGGYRLSFRPDVWRFKLYPGHKEDTKRYECCAVIGADEMLSCWANKT